MVRVSCCWSIRLQGGDRGTEFPPARGGNNPTGVFELGSSSTFLDVDPLFGNYCLNLETPVAFLPTWPSANPSHSSSSFSIARPPVPSWIFIFVLSLCGPCKRKGKLIRALHSPSPPFLTPEVHSSRQVLLSQYTFSSVTFVTAQVYFWGVRMSSRIEESSIFCPFIMSFWKSVFVLIQPDHLMVCQQFGTFFVLSIPSTSQVPPGSFILLIKPTGLMRH